MLEDLRYFSVTFIRFDTFETGAARTNDKKREYEYATKFQARRAASTTCAEQSQARRSGVVRFDNLFLSTRFSTFHCIAYTAVDESEFRLDRAHGLMS